MMHYTTAQPRHWVRRGSLNCTNKPGRMRWAGPSALESNSLHISRQAPGHHHPLGAPGWCRPGSPLTTAPSHLARPTKLARAGETVQGRQRRCSRTLARASTLSPGKDGR